MSSLKIILTFDLDPPTFSNELKIIAPQNYSDEKAILKLKKLVSILETKFDSTIPVTIFLRNATVESGTLVDHSIFSNLRVIKGIGFKKIHLGLHPHMNECVLSNSQSVKQLTQNLINNFALLDENGFKNRIIRFGGTYHCGAISQIIKNSGVQINSSEIFGRNTDSGIHFSECSSFKEINSNQNSVADIPISTTFIEMNQTKKRVYFDFSFKNTYQRDLDSLNIIKNNPYLVSISHPATFFEDIYKNTDKYEFGIDHWLASFFNTYKELIVKFKKIDFDDISSVKLKI
jgi:hypothetical protein